MKKIISLLILIQALSGTMVYANLNTDNVFDIQTENKPILPDSVSNIATFKLYPTQNMWTFLKLNTRNGKIWQVQYDIGGTDRNESILNTLPLVLEEEETNGRFNLYPTQNMYNFILLDQIDGRTWQVQWSIEKEYRGIIPIQQAVEP